MFVIASGSRSKCKKPKNLFFFKVLLPDACSDDEKPLRPHQHIFDGTCDKKEHGSPGLLAKMIIVVALCLNKKFITSPKRNHKLFRLFENCWTAVLCSWCGVRDTGYRRSRWPPPAPSGPTPHQLRIKIRIKYKKNTNRIQEKYN